MVERVYGFTVSVCVCDKMVQDYQSQTVGYQWDLVGNT